MSDSSNNPIRAGARAGARPESTLGATTSRFARQHEELILLAKELVMALDTRTLSADPNPVRRLLAAFSGRLRVHAAMEQEALYPRLLASSDPEVVAKATELLDEIGDIYRIFFTHLGRWSDADMIKDDPESFCRDTMALLHRLRVRMKRETEELYPLADRLEPQSPERSRAHEETPAPLDAQKRSA